MRIRIIILILFFLSYTLSSSISEENNQICVNKTKDILAYVLSDRPFPNKENEIEFNKILINSGSNLNELGDYEQCLDMETTHYFLFEINSKLKLQIGFCYFKECDTQFLKENIISLITIFPPFQKLNITLPDQFNIYNSVKELQNWREEKKGWLIFAIIFLSLLFSMFMINLYLKIKRNSSKNPERAQRLSKVEKIFDCFDYFKNLKNILATNEETGEFKILASMDFFRICSTFLVVLGHCYFLLLFIELKNFVDLVPFFKTFEFTFLLSCLYTVDIFFFLSAFLFVISFQKYLGGKISKFKIFLLAIFNRYIRLLPLYFFLLFIINAFFPYLDNGPVFFQSRSMVDNCYNYWWYNLLYINNFVDMTHECAGHTWYLSADFQLYLYSIVVYIVFNKNKTTRNIVLMTTFIGCCIAQYIVFTVGGYSYNDFVNTARDDYFQNIYIKPYVRITPYLIGIFFADLFLNIPKENDNTDGPSKASDNQWMRNINLKIISSKFYAGCLLFISVVLFLYSVFINYLFNNTTLQQRNARVFDGFFLMFNKITITLSIAIFLHLIYCGYFKSIGKIMGTRYFLPFRRLSYGVYLYHFYFLMFYFYSFQSSTYLRLRDQFFLAIGIFIWCLPLTLIISGFIDSPLVRLLRPAKNPIKKAPLIEKEPIIQVVNE